MSRKKERSIFSLYCLKCSCVTPLHHNNSRGLSCDDDDMFDDVDRKGNGAQSDGDKNAKRSKRNMKSVDSANRGSGKSDKSGSGKSDKSGHWVWEDDDSSSDSSGKSGQSSTSKSSKSSSKSSKSCGNSDNNAQNALRIRDEDLLSMASIFPPPPPPR